MRSAIIIGAGISGLSCANLLQAAGWKTTILEKSRGYGGRCASRTWRGHRLDHGAQYITAKTQEFKQNLEKQTGWATIPNNIFDFDGSPPKENTPRYYHPDGNSTLAKELAQDIDVQREKLVETITSSGQNYVVHGHETEVVIISTPLPQAEKILGIDLGQSTVVPCLTALCAYSSDALSAPNATYAKSRKDSSCSWSACENLKLNRVTSDELIFVLQASPQFSQQHLEEDPAEWSSVLRSEAEKIWNLNPQKHQETWTHRWRYARYTEATSAMQNPQTGIYLTGDGFLSSRVEDAWIAGARTAQKVLINYPA